MSFSIQPEPITRTRNNINISNIQSDNIEVNNRLSVRNDMSTNNLDATTINTEYLGQSSGSTINVTSPNIVMGDTVVTKLVSSGPVSLASIDPTSITSPINGMIVYNSVSHKIQVRANNVWQTVTSVI